MVQVNGAIKGNLTAYVQLVRVILDIAVGWLIFLATKDQLEGSLGELEHLLHHCNQYFELRDSLIEEQGFSLMRQGYIRCA